MNLKHSVKLGMDFFIFFISEMRAFLIESFYVVICLAQSKLLKSSILVVGAGGLGSPALLYLAACGVGKVTLF